MAVREARWKATATISLVHVRMDGRMRKSVKVQDGNTVFHFFECFFPVFYFSRSGEGNGEAGKNVTSHVPLPIYMAVSVSYSSSMVIFALFLKK